MQLDEELLNIIKNIGDDINHDKILLNILDVIHKHESIKQTKQQAILINMLKDCTSNTRLDEFIESLSNVSIIL